MARRVLRTTVPDPFLNHAGNTQLQLLQILSLGQIVETLQTE
jgi:hypothetical protein